MYINEVKRDKETLKKISEFQSSIENLVSWGKPSPHRPEGPPAFPRADRFVSSFPAFLPSP